MEALCIRIMLALALKLQLLISLGNEVTIYVTMAGYGIRNSAAAASSPLSGTKIRQPWVDPLSSAVPPGRRYIPSVFDVSDHQDLMKLLDVGACNTLTDINSFSYVPPLDGTNPNSANTLCQEIYGMRFVLFDLQLVNVDTVDSLSGCFKAQFQLVFHWIEGWEAEDNSNDNNAPANYDYSSDTWFAYLGDEIKTADNVSTCGFHCGTTVAPKMRCCDRMWVPPLQVPSCKVNDVQSVTPQPYLTATDDGNWSSYWRDGKGNYTHYSTRRKWYVGLDVTCPFTPDFRNFPFDYQFLTVDIINPYASRTWLQLNKGFLEANIVDSIAGIDLSPVDEKIDGWRIDDLVISSACGTQQTWTPTFLTQDYLLQILGDHYESQKETIMTALRDIKCAEMKNLISIKNISLSNPSSEQQYNDTKNDYMQRLDTTISKYKECTSKFKKEFKWRDLSNMPNELDKFNLTDIVNMNRSFSFLDLQYPKAPIDGTNFQCVIDAIANLTTPGIRIRIIVQRFAKYYFVKLFLPTCACVAFSFTSFALDVHDLLGRLTVVVPSAIALSTLQGYVIATDIPAVAYMAPTTSIILLSYAIQLLIALECICLKIWPRVYLKNQNRGSTRSQNVNVLDSKFDEKPRVVETQQSCKTKEIQMDRLHVNDQATQECQEEQSLETEKQPGLSTARKVDLISCALLFAIYIIFLTILVINPLQNAKRRKENALHSGYESLWN